ncbi:phage tail protein [Tardiphaga sp. 20_F10_N6_6]|uniref:phage tail protein n=1 Tax=Tardiphaga sp. 20_F10_N6_6 TaxID=3240788 RepID=UPI003F89512F
MASTYFTLLTKAGQAQIANAVATGQTVEWTAMAVGDGNGNPTTPNENQTALVRERYRAQINQLTVDPDNPNYMIAELVIPTDVGGWVVYEVGVFNSAGDMVAVANFPATYKPQISEGSGRDLVVRIVILVSNSSTVTLKIDPAIVLASQKWVADNYLLRAKVAGGTTGQVLAKTDNSSENFRWVDPTAAVQVIVDAKTERQTLAASQTVVTLATLTTQAIAVYIEGVRLIESLDYTKTDATHITLARSYPAGYRVHMYQNDPTSTIADASETERGFTTLATTAEATTGTNNTHTMTPLKTKQAITASAIGIGYMLVTHETSSGVAAGASTANTFVVRVLNTVRANTITGASLLSNQITLPAGTYRIRASTPGNGVNLHNARFYNVTDAATVIIGTSENTTSLAATPSETTQTRSHVDGRITITANNVFELRHYCQEAVPTNGLGSAVSAGGSEVYSIVEIIKEA